MNKSKKLVFFGTEDFSLPSLEALIAAGWNILAVVTKPDSPAGRGQKITKPPVKVVAINHGIKVLQPDKVAQINQELTDINPDFGVLVAYGKIIPQETLDFFPGGIINVHPSLLPKYRGPSPIENAILNGDTETGVSLMQLSAAMDAGPVYYQEKVALNGRETKPELYHQMAVIGAQLLTTKLEQIVSGQLSPQAQDENQITYTKLIKKEDGVLDLSQPAELLERQVRAYAGWPKSSLELFGHKVIVTDAAVINGKFEIKELISPSGKKMTLPEFERGYQSKASE